MLRCFDISRRKYVNHSVARIMNNETDYLEKKQSSVLNPGPQRERFTNFPITFLYLRH